MSYVCCVVYLCCYFFLKVFEKGWVEIMTPFSFTFVHGSKKLILHITKEGIRYGNWEILSKILPPEVHAHVHCFYCIFQVNYCYVTIIL